ncbi:hypothetical protein [Paenibacillus naphthalenovorans]
MSDRDYKAGFLVLKKDFGTAENNVYFFIVQKTTKILKASCKEE